MREGTNSSSSQPVAEKKYEIDSFEDLGLDPRLLKAIWKAGFLYPTPVQRQGLPCLLGGKDALISSPTGTGKTVCYAVPVIQYLLTQWEEQSKINVKQSDFSRSLKALILVPTKELAHQVTGTFEQLNKHSGIRTLALLQKRTDLFRKVALTNILVTTPATFRSYLEEQNLRLTSIDSLRWLIVDEADLLFSFGYENDMNHILSSIPSHIQSVFVSATLDSDVNHFLQFFGAKRDFEKLLIKEVAKDEVDASLAVHHYVQVSTEEDKYLVVFALLKLQVVTGKLLIFVNTVERGFRLKLLLEQFYIRTSLLNAELPLHSRLHCVDQFNRTSNAILIATDEACTWNKRKRRHLTESAETEDSVPNEQTKVEEEFNLSRGLDFQHVSVVLNFDCPVSCNSYIHRAGRTARGNRKGDILTLVTPEEMERLHSHFSTVGLKAEDLGPLKLKMEQVEPFRYRVEDCLYRVTKNVIKEARAVEIKRELLSSEKVKQYLRNHALDHEALKHDKPLITKTTPHLADIPSYLLPPELRTQVSSVSYFNMFILIHMLKL
eukprot:jgi/Galph1/2682/GphlegSOOS_G1332.1